MSRRPLLALLVCWMLLAAPGGAVSATARMDPGPPVSPRAQQAAAALQRVESLAGDRTLALRDLALLKDALPADQRRLAARYLARPTADPERCPDYSCYTTNRVQRTCSPVVCVHWVRRADDRRNGVPGRRYVRTVLATITEVHRTYRAAGYRAPARDGRRGGDGRPDVYLAQIGDQRLYGYCTTDAARVPQHGSAPAYCVLDNDYDQREFPQHTPVQNMQVTAAHEYFHAVQFGYDIGEDAWFMEATATWVEDEVFDRVDDNVGYLGYGPLGYPDRSLDSPRDGYWYGAWIFFRSVTERFPRSDTGLPIIVRRMWRLADAAGPRARDLYSLQAVQRVLRAKGSSVGAQLLQMAAGNLHPRRWYDEGRAYPAAKVDGSTTLTALLPSKTITFRQDHLSSASYRFSPGAALVGDWRLRLALDLAPDPQGSHAVVRVLRTGGRVLSVVLDLSPEGDYTGSVAFSPNVTAVEITVVNGSTRYRCGVGTSWTCHGRALDQDVRQSISVEAVQLAALRPARRAGPGPCGRRPGRSWSTSAAGSP